MHGESRQAYLRCTERVAFTTAPPAWSVSLSCPLHYPGVFYRIATTVFMDIKITQQPLLVWIWAISTVLTIADEQMGLGQVGDIASLVFLAGVVYFMIVIAVRLR
jgi:hypothetical protein